MKTGRPKKYTTEFVEVEAETLLVFIEAEPIPFKTKFAAKRGYPSENLSRWAKENDEFYQALKRLEDVQEYKLVNAMLMKKVDVTAAIFTLKNVAGWRDKRSTEHDFDDGTKRLLQAALAKMDKVKK